MVGVRMRTVTTPLLRFIVAGLELAVSDRRYRRHAWAALEALPINLDAAMELGRAIHAEDGERWSVIAEEWCEWRASRLAGCDEAETARKGASPPRLTGAVSVSSQPRTGGADTWGSET